MYFFFLCIVFAGVPWMALLYTHKDKKWSLLGTTCSLAIGFLESVIVFIFFADALDHLLSSAFCFPNIIAIFLAENSKILCLIGFLAFSIFNFWTQRQFANREAGILILRTCLMVAASVFCILVATRWAVVGVVWGGDLTDNNRLVWTGLTTISGL